MGPIAWVAGVGSIVDSVRSVTSLLSRSQTPGVTPAGAKTAQFDKHLDEAIAQFIKQRDKDGSGSLSLKEFGGDTKTFSRLDTNGDGRLDASELRPLFGQSQSTTQGV